MCAADVNRITFALMALLNEIDEQEVLEFFRKKLSSTRVDVVNALADAIEVRAQLEQLTCAVLTTGMLRAVVVEFLADRELRRQQEEEQWQAEQDPTLLLALAMSQLRPGELIVRARVEYLTRDPTREHELVTGDLFVVDQIRNLNDGTNDAWYCGYRLGDPNQGKKWIFSAFTDRIET